MNNISELKSSDEELNSVLLYADFKEKCVTTNCGDFYYDYSISFDDFIKFAEFIKENRKRYETNYLQPTIQKQERRSS